MSTMPPDPRLPTPLARAERGRWLGGVCAGLARARDIRVGIVRAGFVLAALAGGIGAVAYLACCLIIPAEGERADATGPRGVILVAQACAGCVVFATIGGVAAAVTLFGFGWLVVAAAAAILLCALTWWPRAGARWTLALIAALTIPSLAVAAAGLQIQPQRGHVTVAPAAITEVPRGGYRSGLGTLLVDLRHTAIPATRASVVRIDAGVRRTIVALPHDHCVRVNVRYHVEPFTARLAAALMRRSGDLFSGITVYGRLRYAESGEIASRTERAAGPTLDIDFRSAGGSLYVRDYPDRIDPDVMPDWPGYPVRNEPRPDVTGTPRRAAQRLIRHWRGRRNVQLRSSRLIRRLRPGPCARPGSRR